MRHSSNCDAGIRSNRPTTGFSHRRIAETLMLQAKRPGQPLTEDKSHDQPID
jgi:hypothetical protein